MTILRLELSAEMAAALGGSPEELAREMRLAAAVRWCGEGRISRARAAQLAGASRAEIDAALAPGGATAAAPPSRRYVLTLLGNPTVRQIAGDGREVEVAWRLRKAFQTVAYLALQPDQRATKEEVVEAVWAEASAEAVRKNFHPTLSEARRALAAARAIAFRQGSYQLNPELVWEVDVLRFERLAAAGRELLEGGEPAPALELWQNAWRLYRGPLLAELDSAWILPRRESLRRCYLRVLRDLGRLAAGLGRETLALDAYRSVLLEEPYEERIHLAMMELYARQGRRDLVRRQYVKLQELLLAELDVEPLEETRERYHQLMR